MTAKEEKELVKANQTASLPSIQQLATNAWELFQKTWVEYLKLLGLTIAYIILAFLIGGIIAIPITVIAIGSHFQFFTHLTPFLIGTLLLLALWFILFILSIVGIGIIFPIVSIFILQGKKTGSIFDRIKQSKPIFLPYFLTVLLSGLLVSGSMMLLVIPGLLIAYFFGFVAFEVVVEDQIGMRALQKSYVMIKNHFWEVLGRLLVLEVAVLIVSSVFGRLVAENSIFGLVQFLFSIFASWYARAYVYLLYKEVRARTTFPQAVSLRWVWIVSVIGWAIIVLLIVGLAVGITHLPGMQPNNAHTIHANAV